MGEMRRIGEVRRQGGSAPTFVGRSAELTRLDAAISRARDGHGGAVLLAGDPGIGKTFTAEEVARRAAARGFRVYWGRCHSDEGAPSFWPWLQVLRAHAEQSDPAVLRTELGAHAPVLVAMVPALRERLPVLSAPLALTAEESRFRLLEAVTGMLRRSARSAPWLVLLDDLQWADLPTLQLFRFAAREVRDAPVLLLGTLRDAELEADAAPRRILRETGAERIDLSGFGEAEVAALLGAHLGATPAAAWTKTVCGATGGNPFFVDRVARLLPEPTDGAADPGALRIPEEVRDVILGQIARLDPADARVLAAASVIGRDFEVPLLARVCDLDPAAVLARLSAAQSARLVRSSADARHYGFVHPVIHEVFYASLPLEERATTHLRVGEMLEALANDGELGDRISQLAHHFVQAADLGDSERAVAYADRAASAAATVSAFEEAARLLQSALALQDRDVPDDARRCDLLLRLGEAQRGIGEHAKARAAFGEAAEIARRRGDAKRLARAALGFAGFWASLGFVDAQITALLEEAAAALGDCEPALRVRLLARLVLEHTLGGSNDRDAREAGSAAALALARECGDDAAIAYALYARRLAMGMTPDPDAQQAEWTEAALCAERAGEIDLTLASLAWQAGERLQASDLRGFDAAIAAHARVSGGALHRTSALSQIVWRGMRAVHEGRFEAAEGVISEIPRRFEPPQVSFYAAPSLLAMRWHQGRLGEMLPMVRAISDAMPAMTSGHAWVAWILADEGDLEAAATRIDRVAGDDFDALARNPFWHLEAVLFGQAAAACGHARALAWITPRLEPLARHRAVHATGLADFGPISRTVGLMAAALGRIDVAAEHLEAAVAADAQVGARPHRVHAEIDLARVLLQRGAAGDAARATALQTSARATAESLGMQRAIRDLDALRAPARAAAAQSLDLEAQLSRDASGWTLRTGSRAHPLGDVKGFAQLADLLRLPGRVLPALDLAGDASTLRSDLESLREAMEDAAERGDAERAESLRDALETRVAGSDEGSERARVNVTRAVKLAIRRIGEVEPRLGRDLETNLKTGVFCSYEPDPHHPVRWRVIP